MVPPAESFDIAFTSNFDFLSPEIASKECWNDSLEESDYVQKKKKLRQNPLTFLFSLRGKKKTFLFSFVPTFFFFFFN